MPDFFFFQEQTNPWFGIYQAGTPPPALNRQFSILLHNVILKNGMPHTRPGLRRLNGELAGDGARVVYGMAVYRGDSDRLILACGTKLQTITLPSGGDPIDIPTNLPPGFPARTGARTVFAQLGEQLFICNGVDENLKFNGVNLTRMGIIPPTTLSPPTFSAGGLTGKVYYRATLVSSALNGSSESEPTSALEVVYNNQHGTFSSPAVPNSDPQIDRWNLYRTVVGGSPTGTFFRVNTTPQPLATNIIDNLSDLTLTASTQMAGLLKNSHPPGKFSQLTAHQGRLVGVPHNDPNSIVWSDLGLDLGGIYFKPESWPPINRLPFGSLGGTRITGLVSFFEWLVVFQDFGVWAVLGPLSDEASRTVTPILVAPDNRGVGVSDVGNIALAENRIYFAGTDGIYKLEREPGSPNSALRLQLVSANITKLYQEIDFSKGGVSVYNRDDRQFMFFGRGKP